MTNTDYAYDLAFVANTPAKADSLRYSLEQETEGIDIYVSANKTEFICFRQEGAIFKSVDQFTYFGSNISYTESDVNIHIVGV